MFSALWSWDGFRQIVQDAVNAIGNFIITGLQGVIAWLFALFMDMTGAVIEGFMSIIPGGYDIGDVSSLMDSVNMANSWVPFDLALSLIALWYGWVALFFGVKISLKVTPFIG